MVDDGDERRTALHDFLQQQGAPDIDRPAILVAWAIVLEWMDDNGERWLSKGHASNISTWHAAGMHHEALYGEWPGDD